jgi:hypothetical protein
MRENPFAQLPHQYLPIAIGAFCAGIVVFVVVYAFYLKNLQDLLRSVREPNRKMAPGKVWLLLVSFLNLFLLIPEIADLNIPEAGQAAIIFSRYALSVFGFVWHFYMVNKIAESVLAELVSRNIPVPARPTFGIGMFMCICNTISLASSIPYLAPIALMAGGAGFVAWIMYWVKTNEYKNILRLLPPDIKFDAN